LAKSKLEHHFHTPIVLVIYLVAAALILILLWPWVNGGRHHFLVAQVTRAQHEQQAGDWRAAAATLQRANWLSFGDGAVPLALGRVYESAGEYPAAIRAYQQLGFSRGYQLVGQAALKSQGYALAEKTYAQAVADAPTAANFDQLAVAQYNLGQTANGCHNADKALKADLTDTQAQSLAIVCLIIQGQASQAAATYPQQASQFASSDRQADIYLIQSGAVRIGEQRLEKLSNKSVQDWLILAQIAAQRADLSSAISRAQSGLKLDPTNVQLNQFALKIELARGDKRQVEYYKSRLRQLFVN